MFSLICISYHNFLVFLGLLVYYYIIMYIYILYTHIYTHKYIHVWMHIYILYYYMCMHIIICIYAYYLINLFISLNISMFKSWISMTPEHLIWKCISKTCISELSLVSYYYTDVDACPGLIPELWQKKFCPVDTGICQACFSDQRNYRKLRMGYFLLFSVTTTIFFSS